MARPKAARSTHTKALAPRQDRNRIHKSKKSGKGKGQKIADDELVARLDEEAGILELLGPKKVKKVSEKEDVLMEVIKMETEQGEKKKPAKVDDEMLRALEGMVR